MTPEELAWHASKGLSDLHKQILRAAFEARGSDRRCDVLTAYLVALMVHAKDRRSAQASVCRACAALERRGLVERVRGITKWSGITLTATGLYFAKNADEFESDRDFARFVGHHKLKLKRVFKDVNESAALGKSVNEIARCNVVNGDAE